MIDQAIPGVFLQPSGAAAAVNQDGTVNSASNPAPNGSIISNWVTGVDDASVSDGQMATSAQMGFAPILNTGTIPAYAGAAPGMPSGIAQINFAVTPNPFGTEASSYSVSVNNVASNGFAIYVSK